jgi:cytochrome c oxidase assembly protein subunit 15
MVSMALIATASLLVWRALPKPAGPVSAVNSLLAWPTFLVGIVAIGFGVVVTGAGPHAGDAATPRNGLDLEVWQHFHSYPGYLMLLLISVQLVSQLRLTGASARPLENRVLLLLFATASAQAVIGVVQSRLGVPELLVGVHMLGAACLASLLSFQLFSGRSFTR